MKKSIVAQINELVVSIEAKLKFRNRSDKEKFKRSLRNGPRGIELLDVSVDTDK